MATSFETQIDKFIVDTEAKLLAVMRDSINEVVNEMQKTTGEGGKMRVDTGFLRASGAASLKGLPVGASENPDKNATRWNGENLQLTLANMKIGDVFFWGWTANYAKYRETYDGFMEAAIQNWQNIVNASVVKLKNRLSK